MAESGDLQSIFERIVAETYTEADIAALRRFLIAGSDRNVVQIGKYNIHIGQGRDIQIGDHIYQGPDADAIRQIVHQVVAESPGTVVVQPTLPRAWLMLAGLGIVVVLISFTAFVVWLKPGTASTPTVISELGICGGTPESLPIPAGPENFDQHWGYTFYNTDNSRVLASNTIRSLLGDQNGVWVGYGGRTESGQGGMGHIGNNDGKEHRDWEYCRGPLGQPVGYRINALTQAHDGALWAASDGQGAWRLFKGQWEQFVFDPRANDDLPYGSTEALAPENDNVWVGDLAGLTRYNGFAWQRTIFDRKIGAVAFAPNGDTWIGFLNDGVRLKRADGTQLDYRAATSPLSNDSVRSIVIDNQGRVWIATAGGGVNVFDQGRWTVYQAGPNGLASDMVVILALDKYQRVWAGTDKGASYFDGNQWHAYSNLDTPAIAFGILLNKQCSPEDTVGTVWAGTNGKGLTESTLPAPSPVVISSRVEGVPSKILPKQLFTPTVTVTLAQGYRLTQGDFIQSMDDTSYSSNPLVGLPPGVVVPGGTPYPFSFAGNPMKAPEEQKSYTSTWRVWQCGRYLDPPIKIQFTVSSP